jgi:hypothetical protein
MPNGWAYLDIDSVGLGFMRRVKSWLGLKRKRNNLLLSKPLARRI